MIELFANSGNPDQMPPSVASNLGLHCLPVTHLGVSSLQWVNVHIWEDKILKKKKKPPMPWFKLSVQSY